jgi:hypothetical protein
MMCAQYWALRCILPQPYTTGPVAGIAAVKSKRCDRIFTFFWAHFVPTHHDCKWWLQYGPPDKAAPGLHCYTSEVMSSLDKTFS